MYIPNVHRLLCVGIIHKSLSKYFYILFKMFQDIPSSMDPAICLVSGFWICKLAHLGTEQSVTIVCWGKLLSLRSPLVAAHLLRPSGYLAHLIISAAVCGPTPWLLLQSCWLLWPSGTLYSHLGPHHFTPSPVTASPVVSPGLQKKATTDLREAGAPLISIFLMASVNDASHGTQSSGSSSGLTWSIHSSTLSSVGFFIFFLFHLLGQLWRFHFTLHWPFPSPGF